MTGQTVGRYQLWEPVGRGAMGVVYRAEDPLIHRTVAVKVLNPARGLEPEQVVIARERFRREAQAAGSIDHPHIIRVFDVGETDEGDLYFVMEYLAGFSLDAMIQDAELQVPRSVEIIGQIASALDAAHEAGIVHRDVKPSNVLFTERGAAKLVDFGITQIAASSLTQDLSKLGTPAYMSPEQIGGRSIDKRADLFSLGVLSYEILTGKKPFGGADAMTIAYAITHQAPERISVANPELPPSLDRVFELMMAKAPADRFTSGMAFHEAIVRCLAEQEAARRPAAPVRSGRRGAWALVAASLIVAAAWAMLSRGPQPPPTKPAPPPAAPKKAQAAAPPKPRPIPPPPRPAPAPVPVPTTQATVKLSHRIRGGTLFVTLDGVSIFRESFSKAPLAISQTTTWDPVRVPAGRHDLKAKVIGDNGKTYLSDVIAVELPRSREAAIHIKFKGDRLIVQPI